VNGVATVGSGGGRSGINFTDVNSSIIAAVEVTKAAEAKTIEGSVGGTVNLRTIRPLELDEAIASIRVQGEDSSLSTESIQPRVSGAWGDSWETSIGRVGVVLSGSYTEQEAVSFRPRADRDNLGTNIGGDPEQFLGIQFLTQEQENSDFVTSNFAGTFEWEPSDNLKLYFDAVITDQEFSTDQYRLQASGVSTLIDISVPTAFETVNFGLPGFEAFPAALAGVLEPDLDNDDDDPNLRFTTESNSRLTENETFRIGGQWAGERLSAEVEFATASAVNTGPSLSTTLNFINPNCPLDGSSNDNCVPFIYDLSGDSLAFGINFDSPFAPSVADLVNPANVVLDAVNQSANSISNSNDAVRVDLSYAFADTGITSLDFGVRFNEATSDFIQIDDNFSFSQLEDSPNGTLFSDILITGPTNFGDADGRDLFIQNFLLVDPDLSFEDPAAVVASLENALAANRVLNPQADGALGLDLEFEEDSFYDIEEETTALYAQANFAVGIFRGNVGLRYIDTTVDSTAFGPADSDGNRQLVTTSGSYDFLLPRLNLVAQLSDSVILRAAYGEDINRPNFGTLNTGFSFGTSENAAVSLGDPGLEPEEVESFDLGVEWYFAPQAVVSAAIFRKERTNIFGTDFEGAILLSDPSVPGGQVRETDPSCPGGGIFNPEVIPNVLGNPEQPGLCVDFTIPSNDPETTIQEGIELAVQYDLSSFEDRLGWASGFGFIVNATFQDFSGGSVTDTTSGRGLAVLGDVTLDRGLVDFSESAYNFTLFYEKYGISARARYTFRSTLVLR